MKKVNKKAQTVMGMSFGAIFSIIIIISIIGVAFYSINHFIGVNKCAKIGFFYDDLKDEIKVAWTSGKYKDIYKAELPNAGLLKVGIDRVCFGNLTQNSRKADENHQERLYDFHEGIDANVFLDPPEKACDGKLPYSKLDHVKITQFFCARPNEKGVVEISLKIESTDSLVTLGKIT